MSEIIKYKKTVNLAKPPRLPLGGSLMGCEVAKHETKINGESVVEIELFSDDNLYINGKKIELFLSERQKNGKLIFGYVLQEILENGDYIPLNSNVLDCIYYHPELFPEHWKLDENGNTRYIFFPGSRFIVPRSRFIIPLFDLQCIRFLFWNSGSVCRAERILGLGWGIKSPSALIS